MVRSRPIAIFSILRNEIFLLPASSEAIYVLSNPHYHPGSISSRTSSTFQPSSLLTSIHNYSVTFRHNYIIFRTLLLLPSGQCVVLMSNEKREMSNCGVSISALRLQICPPQFLISHSFQIFLFIFFFLFLLIFWLFFYF